MSGLYRERHVGRRSTVAFAEWRVDGLACFARYGGGGWQVKHLPEHGPSIVAMAFHYLGIMRAERNRLESGDPSQSVDGKRSVVFLPGRWFPTLVQRWDSDHSLRLQALANARSQDWRGPVSSRRLIAP